MTLTRPFTTVGLEPRGAAAAPPHGLGATGGGGGQILRSGVQEQRTFGREETGIFRDALQSQVQRQNEGQSRGHGGILQGDSSGRGPGLG